MAFCAIFEYGVFNDVHYYFGQQCQDCSFTDAQSPDPLTITTGCTECGNDCTGGGNDIEDLSSHRHGCSKKLQNNGVPNFAAPKDDPTIPQSRFQPKHSIVSVVPGSDKVIQVKQGAADKFRARVFLIKAEFTFGSNKMVLTVGVGQEVDPSTAVTDSATIDDQKGHFHRATIDGKRRYHIVRKKNAKP